MLAACRHGSCAARGSDKCITSSVLEQTQAAAAALRSRLLAPSISTPAAASSPGDTRPWNAFSKYDHFKHEIFIRTPHTAASSSFYSKCLPSQRGQHGQGEGTSLGARIER